MFRSNFDKNLENATSHLRLEPDWPSILLICDEINQKDVTPKSSFAAIKKKMTSPNPHSACYALMVLESVVKNCGAPIHDEVFTKENCEMFSTFLEQTPHENVRQKMLELIQTWAYAFRSSEKYQAIKDTMTILKTKGHSFPELKETDAMFTADTAPNWADGKVCHRCRSEFTFTNRKHHCRNCGQVFCGQCTAKQCPLPKYGIEKEVRVCDGCFTSLQKSTTIKSTSRTSDSDLPAEYLNSSLAQQEQTPVRKSDQEWKELEELHLALALSQSEAEEKKKHKSLPISASCRSQQSSPVLETPAQKEYAQQEENTDLAKYLNRTYWEQRKVAESLMDSPSAPSPMPTPQLQSIAQHQKPADEIQIDEFAGNMRTQVEIFVNRMKSNSSRGRSIANDSSVQTLFLTLTSLHSQQLSFIKEMDDKRMWFEQLQDKLVQIKDSRAALDVLRQEHVEKLRRIAEEQERQRQIQMAQKLDIMRKKKQEYLQYQRQLALQRIQEQEREMQMRQEQQKAQYRMGQTSYPFIAPNAVGAATHNSPSHHMSNVFNPFTYNANPPVPIAGIQYNTQNQPVAMGGAPAPIALAPLPGMYTSGIIAPLTNQNQHSNMLVHGPINTGMLPPNSSLMSGATMQQQHSGTPPIRESMLPGSQAISQQQQPRTMAGNVPDQQQTPHVIMQHPNREQVPSTAIAGAMPLSVPVATNPPQMAAIQDQAGSALASTQIEAVAAAPIPPQADPEPPAIARPAAEEEPATAELISFD